MFAGGTVVFEQSEGGSHVDIYESDDFQADSLI